MVLVLLGERPGFLIAAQIPGASAFAGDGDSHRGSCPREDVAISKRQSAHETVEHGIVKFTRQNSRISGTLDTQANLLLMVPPFRVFAGGVKPVCGFFFARPAYAVRCLHQRVTL